MITKQELILHPCEDCELFTDYLQDGADYGFPSGLWYCENCAIARAEHQTENDFTSYWEGHTNDNWTLYESYKKPGVKI